MNSTKGKRERIGRMFQMHADKREEIKEAFAGDIVALVGLKDTGPATRSAIRRSRWCWRRWTFPEPVIEIAIEPKTKDDQEKMAQGLQRLAAEDPSLPRRTDTRAARPSCRAWASCISRSSSTG